MIEDYRRARKIGKREVADAVSAGRYPNLPSFDEVIGDSGGGGEVPVGVMEIPLELVAGTKTRSRANVFSPGFMPIADEDSEFASKWSDLYDAQLAEGIRDPVVVYEYLQRFYVAEGNKRVSVLRYLGVPTITASITRVMPGLSDDDAMRRYHEFLELFRVAPVYGLVFSREESTRELAELVGLTLDEPWPDEVVRDLKATMRQFTSAFRAHGGDALGITEADALLVYVRTYATSCPLCVTQPEMDERVDRIWDEIVVQSKDDAIAFIEDPTERKGGIVKSIVGLSRELLHTRPMDFAFVYDRNPYNSGWTALHERGRLDLQRRLGGDEVRTSALFDCATDADFDDAVKSAVNGGADVVVTVSPRQMEQTRRVAAEYPGTTFINCSINLSSSLVRTFYARMYEVKFLMGALAACLAENHRVGYLAISPIYGSVAEINAFAIGVQMVDPHAVVYLKWVSAEGYDWRTELHDSDVRVLAGRDYPNPQNPGESFGLTVLDAFGRPQRVAAPVWDWGRYYELIVRSLHDDTWRQVADEHRHQALNYWWGMSADVVRLELEPDLPPAQARLVAALEHDLLYGILHPFDGPLVAQRGVVVRERGAARLSNEEIASMRWLNSNVNGRLPKQWELSHDGAAVVAVSGVISDETDAEDN
ncbi:MAG: BMP family ABC transporter substrate-binding protein [Eggerthellaceae bacterium]|nr:BMP family ABC transporter substrate-binding protein [Eggerthellaceae bacterium]